MKSPTIFVDDLHCELVVSLALAHEPHCSVRTALDLADHLEVGERRRLADGKRVRSRLLNDGCLQLRDPLHTMLQGGQLASAGSL